MNIYLPDSHISLRFQPDNTYQYVNKLLYNQGLILSISARCVNINDYFVSTVRMDCDKINSLRNHNKNY